MPLRWVDGASIPATSVKEITTMKGNLIDEKELTVTVQDVVVYAKLNNVDVAKLSFEESERIMNEIKLNKRQNSIISFVNERHVTAQGYPRKIYKPAYDGGLWYTQNPNNLRQKVRAKTKELLYMKLYDIYTNAKEYSVEAWFKIGIEFRRRKSNPRQATIDRHERTKNSYFTQELLSSDIRELTSSDIWDFMKEAQERHHMSLSEAKQLKGTLNVVFEAASDPEIGCRNYNPMLSINPGGLYKNNPEAIRCNESKKQYSAFSDEQIEILRNAFRERIETNRNVRYDRCQYALMGLLASYTGMRASELPALRWEDVRDNHIHLHQMQTRNDGQHGSSRFDIVPWLKEEKGSPRGGRDVPFLSPDITETLDLIKEVQAGFNIQSEWIFPDSNSLSYERSMYKLCTSLGYSTTNNHAFRKGFNMWMLSQGLNVADRAKILGHSTAVNLERYTVVADNWIENAIETVKSNEVTTKVTTKNHAFLTIVKGFKPA